MQIKNLKNSENPKNLENPENLENPKNLENPENLIQTTFTQTNRLIHESSPYLLQHAHNPVDWYPWGEEAFIKAKEEDKPVFLSIGYSTCHWCHVMERESFEDEAIGEILNRHFISIKVDKEERPDVDGVYMQVCMAATGGGGWPLTVIMTPDKKPFFAGTYLPKNSRRHIIGLTELLEAVRLNWQEDNSDFINRAEEITQAVQDHIKLNSPGTLSDGTLSNSSSSDDSLSDNIFSDNILPDDSFSDDLIGKAYRYFAKNFDKNNGGFGNAPKFPSPHNLLFLMEYYRVFEEKNALIMAEKTLSQMYLGGIFDHIGYGFSRYSTDERWLAPHFEKMLYDNAMLTMAYTKAYAVTGREIYKDVAQKIIQYVLRDLTHPEGGFYCAEDADSDGEEGKFYLLEPKEVVDLLGREAGGEFNRVYNITENGNFEGKNIPNLLKASEASEASEVSVIKVFDPEKFNNEKSNNEKSKLREYRKQRYSLHKDDKILTSWNGLMIGALAQAHMLLSPLLNVLGQDNINLLELAKKSLTFIENHLMENGEIFTSYREGRRSSQGFLEDYASITFAMIEIYRASWNLEYLHKAKSICEKAIQLFFDGQNGGFRLSGIKNESLILDLKETFDGASPSGNSIMAYNLVMLSKLGVWKNQDSQKYQNILDKHNRFMAKSSENHPGGHCFFWFAKLIQQYPGRHITCVLSPEDNWENLKEEIKGKSASSINLKDTIISVLEEETKDYPLLEGKTTYYTCDFGKCYPPSHKIN